MVHVCVSVSHHSYVSRAFSTLEGIGLSINEDYSILQECYPYLAKRLLTDNSPRARNALQAMLYGSTTPSNTGAATSTTHVLEPWTANSYADQASHNAYFNNRATSAASGASGGAAFAAAGVAAAAAAQSNTHGNNSNGNEADAAAAEAAAAGAARRRQRLGRSALGGGLVGAAGAAAMSGSGSIIDIASSSRRSSTGDSIVGAAGAGSNGNLQAKKVVEMGQGFASYTAATSDADAGKGVAEALNSALDLLLADDADPNFVQEVRVGVCTDYYNMRTYARRIETQTWMLNSLLKENTMTVKEKDQTPNQLNDLTLPCCRYISIRCWSKKRPVFWTQR